MKYGSPLAQAEAESRAAERSANQARVQLIQAGNHRTQSLAAVDEWRDRVNPDLAAAPDRPYYRDALGGNGAVTIDGEPIYADEQKRQRLGADVIVTPPVSEDRIVELEAAVTEAEAAAVEARANLGKARSERKPMKGTGFVVVRPGRIGGVGYSKGDPFRIDSVAVGKAEQLLSHRVIARTGLS